MFEEYTSKNNIDDELNIETAIDIMFNQPQMINNLLKNISPNNLIKLKKYFKKEKEYLLNDITILEKEFIDKNNEINLLVNLEKKIKKASLPSKRIN